MNLNFYWFYFVPLCICLFGYTLRTYFNVQFDKQKKEEFVKLNLEDKYYPKELRIDIFNRILVSFIPVINIIAMVTDIFPELFHSTYEKIETWLEQPIISRD